MSEQRAPSADSFKAAMRHFPTGVTIVTSFRGGEPRGVTVSAFSSVSLAPPSVLICINREARSYLYIAESKVFCVNFLAADQSELAQRFSGLVHERQFENLPHATGITGAPILNDALAYVECAVEQEHHAGSHSIFIGRVLACASRPGTPLGYYNGGFHDFGIRIE